MSMNDIRKGCTEYIISCAKCDLETVAHEPSKYYAAMQFRKQGWVIGYKANICPDCNRPLTTNCD